MDPDFYGDIPNGERDANALDRALDEFVRGKRKRVHRLEPDLGITIDRMFALADVSGMSGAVSVPQSRRLLPWKVGIPMKQVVSIASTFAAVVILAIGINATVPGFRDQNAGLGTAVPTSDAENYSEILAPTFNCNVKPRTREEVVEILSISPSVNATNGGSGQAGEGDVAVLQDALNEFQACWQSGDFWRAMALMSDQYIRTQVYGSSLIETAYSEQTINELIDGQIELFNNRSMVIPDAAYPLATITNFPSVSFDANGVDAAADVELIFDGHRVGDWPIGVVFVLEDGVWRIWSASGALVF